jgi:predicted adenine nucleotide alpha hydrolase (AANH) superfamily ATPase
MINYICNIMREIGLILNLIDRQIDLIKQKLRICPFYFTTEHDVQSLLYSDLIENDNFNGFCKNSNDLPNFRIHTEYPRINKTSHKQVGRWDIAILKEGKYDNDDFSKAPTWLGIEIKQNWNDSTKRVIECFDIDMPAVDSTNGENNYADWALLFHINIAKDKFNQHEFQEVKDWIEENSKINKKTIFVYIESYRNNELFNVIRSDKK